MLTKDLPVTLCDMKSPNPLCLSSSLVGNYYEVYVRTYDTGWGDVVFKAVGFFIVNEVSPRFGHLVKEDTDFISLRNMKQITGHPLEENLAALHQSREDYPNKILIASIMGENKQQWGEPARLVREVGADMIEYNFSCLQMTSRAMDSDAGQGPELIGGYCWAVRCGSTLPMLVKIAPSIGDICEVALTVKCGGVDGIVTVNTVKSITNVDLSQKIGMPIVNDKSSTPGYSGKVIKPITLRFIQQMRTYPELHDFPTSGTGDIKTWEDAVEFLLLGAATLQMATGTVQYGYRIAEDMASGLSHCLTGQRFNSLQETIGLVNHDIVPAEDLDRSYIIYPHINLDKCVGCGRYYVSCYDDGHQAMGWSEKTRTPYYNTEKCAGHPFRGHVCPVGYIDPGEVRSKKGGREHPVTLQNPNHSRHLAPVAGRGLSAPSGLQDHANQYTVSTVG